MGGIHGIPTGFPKEDDFSRKSFKKVSPGCHLRFKYFKSKSGVEHVVK